MRSIVVSLVLFVTVAAGTSSSTHAHGARTEAIDLSGTPPAQWIALSFGGVITRDGGGTWNWFCEEVLGYPLLFNPRVVLEPGGGLLSSTQRGIAHSYDGGCRWRFTSVGKTDAFVTAMAADPSAPDEILVTAGINGGTSGIYRSIDHGLAFTPIVERDLVEFSGALRAGNRAYAVMRPLVQPVAPTLFRSLDGGAGFTEVPLAVWVANDVAELLAIDVNDPDTIYLAIRSGVPADRLARLQLAGAMPVFSELLATGSRIRAFAQRKDGSLWLATALGLKVSPDGGATWINPPGTPPEKVTCLVDGAQGLCACADDATDGYAIGCTVDGSAWEPLFRYRDMTGPIACPADSPTAVVCGAIWPDISGRFLPDAGVPPDAAPAPQDAAVDGRTATSVPGGCGCRTGGRSSPGAFPLAVLLLFPIARRTRRQPARSTLPSACRAKRPSPRA